MSAVKSFLNTHHCDINVVLDNPQVSTDDFAPFSIRITLAKNMYGQLPNMHTLKAAA